jgi:hypothetical protein
MYPVPIRSRPTCIYDGTPCMKVSTPPLLTTGLRPRSPFLIALSQAMGIGLNENSDAPPVPGTEQIDYVRVWK